MKEFFVDRDVNAIERYWHELYVQRNPSMINGHQGLKDSRLQEIAAEYMERIGFDGQPFLVYRHDDAAHFHLHIFSTNVTAQSERIDLHDIGKKLSESTRKAIETKHGLIKTESKLFKA